MSTRVSSPLGTKDDMAQNICNIIIYTSTNTLSSVVECLDGDEGANADN